MQRKTFLATAVLTVALCGQASAQEKMEPTKFVGIWETQGNLDGLREVWDIKIVGNQWKVIMAYYKGNIAVGQAVGLQPLYADGKLFFIRKYLVKPNKGWHDLGKITAEIRKDGKLHYQHQHQGGSSSHTMALLGGAVIPPEVVEAALQPFAGKWESEADGLKEVWDIKVAKGNVTLEMTYFDKDKEVGSATGTSPILLNGELKIAHKYTKKPKDDIKDGVGVLKFAIDKLTYTFQAKGATNPSNRILAKVGGTTPTPTPAVVSEADAKPFVGSWESVVDTLKEVVDIQFQNNQMTLRHSYFNGDKLVGSALGENPAVTNGELKYTFKLLQKPVPSWNDTPAAATVKVANDKLFLTAPNGLRFLAKATTTVGNPPPPANEPDLKALAGIWEGDIDGHKEIWMISQVGGFWSVKGYFVKNGEKVGAFLGKNAAVVNGKLQFVQDFAPQPFGTFWNNGSTVTVAPDGAGISYTWMANGATGTRKLLQYR